MKSFGFLSGWFYSSSWTCLADATLPPAKSRIIAVRLISLAMTGFYKTMRRPRTHRPLSMMRYDPVGE